VTISREDIRGIAITDLVDLRTRSDLVIKVISATDLQRIRYREFILFIARSNSRVSSSHLEAFDDIDQSPHLSVHVQHTFAWSYIEIVSQGEFRLPCPKG